MPKSKNNKSHNQRVNNFKNKTKKQMNNQEAAMSQQYPEVRSIPVWDPQAKITISGAQFEILNNSLLQIREAQQVIQGVLSENIVSGVISMDFEKIDPKTLTYGPMTDAEKAPYVENVRQAIEAIKNPAKAAELAQKDQAYQAALAEHEGGTKEETSSSILAADGKPAKKTKGKLVQMGS